LIKNEEIVYMKSEKKYSIGVIGLGVFGARHASVCLCHPNFQLVGVVDVRQDLVEKYSQELGVPGFVDYHDLLEIPGIDVVTVATSDQFHHAPCKDAAQKGINIFLEKPIADSSAHAKEIIQDQKAHHIKLMVGHTLRYDPRYVAIKQTVMDGKLGDIIHVYARRNATVTSGRRLQGRVDAMIFQGVHDLDFLQWLTDSKVIKVYAEAASNVLKDLNVNDTTMATLRFENGVIGLLEQSWALPAGMPSALDVELEVVGTEGSAYLDLRSQSISVFSGGKLKQPDLIYELPDQHFLFDEYTHLACYLDGRTQPKISGEEALSALEVAEAIMQSAKIGKPVLLP
jgi:predicted dehydrogenase